MIKIIEKFLSDYELLDSKKTFLVGFSGGCDSLCLLDLLVKLSHQHSFKVVAMHLNHNWREGESIQEEENCKAYCARNNLECVIKTLDDSVQKTENSAREARYAFFNECAHKYSNSCIFTGHTSSDNSETIIYRIVKGTGLNGLKGIPAERMLGDVKVFRPLLSISRQHTEDYCSSNGLIPNSDSSNFDINYKRNFIRHKIMPLLKEVNYNAEKSINSLAKLATSQCNIIDEYITKIKQDVYEGNRLLTPKFRLLSDDVMMEFIYYAFLKYHFDYDYKKISNALEFMKANFDSKSGSRYSISNNLWIFVNSKYIYLISNPKGEKTDFELKISQEGEYNLPDDIIFKLEKVEKDGAPIKYPPSDAFYAYVELPQGLTGLTLRTRREGDYICPFGMTGKMKLKKFLNSKSVSLHEKDGLILLCQDSEVLWVAGVGLSNKLKVVNQPTHVLKLEKIQRGI